MNEKKKLKLTCPSVGQVLEFYQMRKRIKKRRGGGLKLHVHMMINQSQQTLSCIRNAKKHAALFYLEKFTNDIFKLFLKFEEHTSKKNKRVQIKNKSI